MPLQTECVFLILTSIGRDLEQESPALLERIMAAVRDALINCSLLAAVSKTLLQVRTAHRVGDGQRQMVSSGRLESCSGCVHDF